MKRISSFLIAGWFFVAGAQGADLSIGLLGVEHPEGCFEQSELSHDDAAAYADHISGRFASSVVLCFGEEALRSNENGFDLLWGARQTLVTLQGDYRPFLTPRRSNGLGRVPVVVFKRASTATEAIADLRGERLALSDHLPATLNRDIPLELLSNFGLSEDDFELVFVDGPNAVAEAVATGAADIGALEATSWARTCEAYGPNHPDCDQLEVLLNLRPRAEQGMVIGNDISKEIRYRMVGVHTRLHLENEVAFRWLVGADAPELEPTEQEAFTIGLSE